MDCSLSYNNSSVLRSLPSTVKPVKSTSSSQRLRRLLLTSKISISSFSYTFNYSGNRGFGRPISFSGRRNQRALIAVASAEASHCEFGSLSTPLEPKSLGGKFLSSVLQNDREYFHVAVAKQLVELAYDRYEAIDRMNLMSASSEACLHSLQQVAGCAYRTSSMLCFMPLLILIASIIIQNFRAPQN